MFYKKENSSYRQPLEGVSFKSLVYGEKTHLTEFKLDKGSNIPKHAHHHEQTGYLISGRMKFTIAGEVFLAEEGDGWNIPSDVEHGVEVLENAVVIEVFSPAREDYL
jgi:quercetin dioxygenase-like cupin family protein